MQKTATNCIEILEIYEKIWNLCNSKFPKGITTEFLQKVRNGMSEKGGETKQAQRLVQRLDIDVFGTGRHEGVREIIERIIMDSTKTVNFRQRLAAIVLAAALAFSMGIALPAMAFADEGAGSQAAATTGYINPSAQTINAVVGQQVNLMNYITSKGTSDGSDAHLDFKVMEASGIATVNKHSGILTPSAAGSITVTVYLTPGATPSQNPNNPCDKGVGTLAVATITVNVSSTSTYGFQGSDNTVKITNHAVGAWSIDGDSYVNELGTLTPTDGVLTFNYRQTAGFKDTSVVQYASIAPDQITKKAYNGDMVALYSYNDETTRFLSAGAPFAAPDLNTTNNTDVSLSVSGLGSGDYELIFYPGFRGNSPGKTLGSKVIFAFSI